MPVELHARRPDLPLGRRDRRLLALLACLAVAGAVVAAVQVFRGSDAAPVGRSCVTAIVPSTMGGATVHSCGAQAAAFCNSSAADYVSVRDECRALRLRRADP
jgi:hypothetical protein